jgi:hypothetical protein
MGLKHFTEKNMVVMKIHTEPQTWMDSLAK